MEIKKYHFKFLCDNSQGLLFSVWLRNQEANKLHFTSYDQDDDDVHICTQKAAGAQVDDRQLMDLSPHHLC